jgi:D-alanyl-D-alanine carboxypeptidase (penicillin-binding protein 5/6)
VDGQEAILVDAATGQELYARNADEPRPIASTTKIMTAILILESGGLDRKVTVSKNAEQTLYTAIHLKAGEKLTLHDLLVGILLRSANDACVAAAEFLDGSVAKFVERMNRRAGELGLRNTHFMNPHGLNDPEHYSCARDLAILARHAVRFPLFSELVRSRKRVIARQNPTGDRLIYNRSRLLWKMKDADGIKTGYTKQAGNCFVGSATRGGWRLISVVLASHSVYPDTQRLLEYGFARYRRQVLAMKGARLAEAAVTHGTKPKVGLRALEAATVVVPREQQLRPEFRLPATTLVAPVRPGTSVAKGEFVQGQDHLAEVPLGVEAPVAEIHPGLSARMGGFLEGYPIPFLLLGMGLVILGYGTNPKAAVRRWSRLKKAGRGVDPRGPRNRRR